MSDFAPGRLTAPQAARLNEMWRELQSLRRMSAAPPLVLTREAGVPVIRAPDLVTGDAVVARVTGDDGGTPPVYSAVRETRDPATNLVADYAPTTAYDRVLGVNGATFAAGDYVTLVPIPDQSGWWWAAPLGAAAAPGFFARLTTSGSNGSGYGTMWKYVQVAYDDVSGYGWHDVGGESADYVAVPVPYDGTHTVAPYAGMRVRMFPSAELAGVYEFLPDEADGFFARLTTSGSNGSGYGTAWKYVRQAWYDSAGYGWHDVDSESADYVAFPTTLDGTNYAAPAAGLRVWMKPSEKLGGCFEFEPYGYADGTHPGLVSITAQSFAGDKTFLDNVEGDGDYIYYFDAIGTYGTSGARMSASAGPWLPTSVGGGAVPQDISALVTGGDTYTGIGAGNFGIVEVTSGDGGTAYIFAARTSSSSPHDLWLAPEPLGGVAGRVVANCKYAYYSGGNIWTGISTLINYTAADGSHRTMTFKGGILVDDEASGS